MKKFKKHILAFVLILIAFAITSYFFNIELSAIYSLLYSSFLFFIPVDLPKESEACVTFNDKCVTNSTLKQLLPDFFFSIEKVKSDNKELDEILVKSIENLLMSFGSMQSLTKDQNDVATFITGNNKGDRSGFEDFIEETLNLKLHWVTESKITNMILI